ncbi:MAG: zinc metallopeptidase [Thiotrichaceae bacterium]|nr:zinc metallopeptidase [Thiotrichaceae bacterium]
MDKAQWRKHKLFNSIQSLVLIVALAIILGFLGNLIGGKFLAFFAIGGIFVLYFFNPVVSPYLVLKTYRTRLITPAQAPNLYAVLRLLAKRADLPSVPKLYYLPSNIMNAFAVGMPENAVITLSDGILRSLSPREIAAVLAHEISHIAHEDMRIMGFADLVSRLTNFLSLIGQFLLILSLPLLLFGIVIISWTAIFILIFAPIVTDLLQLALSRNREYDADLGAVRLLNDPEALASALLKMGGGSILTQILKPGYHSPEPSLLRTHPPIKERIRRILSLRQHASILPFYQPDLPLFLLMAPTPLRPLWHLNGIRF